jgi:hypothetical protein
MLGFLGAILAALVLTPSMAFAQAAIAGVVKDTSGGFLPGVTVEAASPALIEKVRAVSTDGSGQYRIENLRPGVYAVTFTLPGFNAVKRDGFELVGSATVTINADLNVGSVEETITVTGESPMVDTKSTTAQRVMTQEVINSIPSGRLYSDLAAMVPGMKSGAGQVGQTQNTGGALGDTTTNLMIHGSKTVDMRITQNGLPTGTLQAGGGSSMSTANMTAAAEVTMDTGAASAELPTGGPRINFVPKDGGNQVRGAIFSSFANSSMQGNNFTQRLKDRRLTAVDAIRMNADFNPGFGGPIKRDSVWFYTAARVLVADVYPAGILPNLNANNPSAWTYLPDTSGTLVENNAKWTDVQGRVTWQATARNRFAGSYDRQDRCSCPYFALATRAPESGANRKVPNQHLSTLEWFSPVTSRLLVEASALNRFEHWENAVPNGFEPTIGVLNQDNNLQYRGGGVASGTYLSNDVPNWAMRAALSYITGSHAVKVGMNNLWGTQRNLTYTPTTPLFYRASTVNGVYTPNQVTEFATPYEALSDQDMDLGIYAQDKWTIDRFTINGGIRFDWYKSSFPEQTAGPALLAPNRNIKFAAQDNLDFKDITPRLGIVWDAQGNGKTAVRASMNKYLNGQGLNLLGTAPNPILSLVNSASRSWTDADRDWVVDCDLTSVAAQSPATTGSVDTCGSMTANFGRSVPGASYDPELLTGWGHRLYNWEFALGIQQEIMPRVSVDVGYYRRIFGNFQATDNRNLTPGDFTKYSIVVPGNSTPGAVQLPNVGATITDLYNITPAAAALPFNLYNTLASTFGKQIEHWNGVDVNVTARLAALTLAGGLSSGKALTDNCEIVQKLPEIFSAQLSPTGTTAASLSTTVQPLSYCHLEEPFLTDARAQAIYRIPKIDVQVAGTYQNVPGPNIVANFTATNAFLATSSTLGRPLAASATSQSINLMVPNTEYGERVNQIDMRVSKIFRMGQRRLSAGIDIYNVTNADTVLGLNNTYTTNTTIWQRPTQVVMARFLKLSATLDF